MGNYSDDLSLEIFTDDDEKSPERIVTDMLISLQTPPFLGTEKTIWLQNVSFLENEGGASALKQKDPLTTALARIAEFIASDFPEDLVLVISGKGVSEKRRLFKSCSENGKVFIFNKPDLSRKSWRQEVEKIIRNRMTEREMRLTNESINYLIEVIGVDTGRIGNEIEKLFCYAGTSPSIKEVQDVCTGSRETVFFALSNALGTKNIDTVFSTITQLLGHSKEPEGLIIGQIRFLGRYFTDLLQAKLLMFFLKTRSADALSRAIQQMNDEEKNRFHGNTMLSKQIWQVKSIAQQASRYTGPELIHAIKLLAEADKLLVSSSLSRTFILEFLALRILTYN